MLNLFYFMKYVLCFNHSTLYIVPQLDSDTPLRIHRRHAYLRVHFRYGAICNRLKIVEIVIF